MQYELVAEGIGQACEHYVEAAEDLAHEFLRSHHMDLEDAYSAYQDYQSNPNSEGGKLWGELEVFANQVLYGEMHENSLIVLALQRL